MISRYLDDLESRIDSAVEEQLVAEWKSFSDGEFEGDIFSPNRTRSAPASVDWPDVKVNEALDSLEKMALQQLSSCSAALAGGGGAILNVRSNYGTGILSSVFGAEIFRMDDALNTLPTSRALAGGTDDIRRLVQAEPPDLSNSYGGKALEAGEYFVELFKPYPKIAKYVHIYHPDIQGPMDIAELLWGSEIFLALIDTPDLVHALLRRVTDTYRQFMERWEQIVPPTKGYAAHWGLWHKGRIMLRDDSAMNLSPDVFEEFIRPYDQELLAVFGGGVVHSCGRVDHYIHLLAGMDGLYAFNMSQPDYNDMEHVFQHTVDRGIALLGLGREAAEAALDRGRDLHGLVHCW